MTFGFFVYMPTLTPETEKLRAENLTKRYLQAGMNQAELARRKGVHRATINKQVNKPLVRDCLSKFLGSDSLKQALIEVAKEGLEAQRVTNASILVDKNGQVIKSEDHGGIETPDHNARHKFWHDLLVHLGKLDPEEKMKYPPIINVIHYCPHGKTA